MLPSHRRAITDILACRTEALGGHLWRCDACSHEVYSYHSCKNRSCPKCHTDQTERWLEARKLEMLPCRYFHVTITVPEELRDVLRANQRDGYGLLMKAAADSIIEIARDPRYVGATVGVLAVLHTWTQQLNHHPHVHCLVTGGGVSDDGSHWHPARNGFLVPVRALAKLVRGKLKAALAKRRPDLVLPKVAWRKPWVVHCTAWGEGDEAVLRYLARYVFRVAITNTRIVGLDDKGVTIRHKERKSRKWQTTRLSGHEFMRRIPAARFAQRCAQGPLLRPLASGAARARSTSPSHALARPPDDAGSSDIIRRDELPRRRSVGQSHTIRRDTDLPVL